MPSSFNILFQLTFTSTYKACEAWIFVSSFIVEDEGTEDIASFLVYPLLS